MTECPINVTVVDAGATTFVWERRVEPVSACTVSLVPRLPRARGPLQALSAQE